MKNEPFLLLITWDHKKPSFGIRVFDGVSNIVSFSSCWHSFSAEGVLDDVFMLSEFEVGFYDYRNSILGVVHLLKEKLIWKKTLKEPDLVYVGKWLNEQMAFQIGKEIVIVNAQTGEQLRKEFSQGVLRGGGYGWSLFQENDSLCLKTLKGELTYKRKNSMGVVTQIENYVVFIERQGPLRVVDLRSGTLIFEQIPESGSEFADVYISPGNDVIFTQHFFDRPGDTIVHRHNNWGATGVKEFCIPCSGWYIFVELGNKIVFTNKEVYSTISGDLLKFEFGDC